MRTKPTAITELPSSPDDERRARMIRYSIAMGIRMVCIVLVRRAPGLVAADPRGRRDRRCPTSPS